MSAPHIIRRNKKPLGDNGINFVGIGEWLGTVSILPWFIISLLWIAFIGLNYFYATHTDAGLNAFWAYYRGADALLNNAPLYNGLDGWIYLYPPLFAQMLMPIVVLDSYDVAIVLWYVINIVLLIASLFLLSRYVPPSCAKLLWFTPIVFLPFWQALYLGQVTIIMLALLTLAWVCMREDRAVIAGMLLALASWIKVFPAILILYFIFKRDWRVLWGVVLIGTGLAILQVLISGSDLMFEFFDILLSLTAGGQPEGTYENLSVLAFASRLFEHNDKVVPIFVDDTLFKLTRWGLTAFIILTSAIAIWYSGASTRMKQINWRFDLEYSLMVMTILLFGGTLWISGLPPLLLLYVLLLRNVDIFRLPSWVKGLSVASFVLITTYQPLVLMLMEEALDVITLSLGFLGVLILWFLLIQQLLQSKSTERITR